MQHPPSPYYRATHAADTVRAQGRSITWLARQLGFSRQYTSDVLHGHYAVRRETVDRISVILGTPFFLIFKLSDGDLSAPTGDQPTSPTPHA